jgi:hypothetical protein
LAEEEEIELRAVLRTPSASQQQVLRGRIDAQSSGVGV